MLYYTDVDICVCAMVVLSEQGAPMDNVLYVEHQLLILYELTESQMICNHIPQRTIHLGFHLFNDEYRFCSKQPVLHHLEQSVNQRLVEWLTVTTIWLMVALKLWKPPSKLVIIHFLQPLCAIDIMRHTLTFVCTTNAKI